MIILSNASDQNLLYINIFYRYVHIGLNTFQFSYLFTREGKKMKTKYMNDSLASKKDIPRSEVINKDSYEEILFSKISTVILSVITTAFFLIYIYEIIVEPSWDEPLPNWFWLIMAVILLGVTINFSRMKIKINNKGIMIRSGVIKNLIPWKDVKDCSVDEGSPLKYGGWGQRFWRVKGNFRIIYNAAAGKRIAISLNSGIVREIVFSTRNPEKVMRIIKTHIS